RDLGDLDASAVDEEHRLSRIAGQVDDLPPADLPHLDLLHQAVQCVGRQVLEQGDLLHVPERALLVRNHAVLLSVTILTLNGPDHNRETEDVCRGKRQPGCYRRESWRKASASPLTRARNAMTRPTAPAKVVTGGGASRPRRTSATTNRL